MKIGVPKETARGERRVALTPEGVKELVAKGDSVTIETGAGDGAFFLDSAYEAVGAAIAPSFSATVQGTDLVVMVTAPTPEQISQLPKGGHLISFLWPQSNGDTVHALAAQEVSAMAMDLMPRISRAQSMDSLSSMSTIAGYKAVLLCAEALPRFFPMLMTAAGTIPAARMLVIGAGVAGLQAIATARRLGALVEAFDVRPAVKEQIESLGAKFIGLNLISDEAEDAGGYAKEVSSDTHAKELELIASRLPNVDAVVTTALIPGRPAPILITDEMLTKMKPGSVIVDLAAVNGGNCEGVQAGETVSRHGVTLIGRTDLVAGMSSDASRMYSKNITAFVAILRGEAGINLDMEDEIVKGTLVTQGGKIVHEVTRLALERGKE